MNLVPRQMTKLRCDASLFFHCADYLPFLIYLPNYLMIHIGNAGTLIAVVESKQERLSVQKPEDLKPVQRIKKSEASTNQILLISSCTFQPQLQ